MEYLLYFNLSVAAIILIGVVYKLVKRRQQF